MNALVASTRFIDLVMALVVFEVIVVAIAGHRSPRGVAALELGCNALAGLGLLAALRAALAGADAAIPLALALAGVAHVADLWLRHRRRVPR